VQVEEFFAEEQMELRRRLESMQLAEKKKQDQILQRQQQHAENLRRKRAEIEQRIEQNMEMAKMIEEKKKADFIERQQVSSALSPTTSPMLRLDAAHLMTFRSTSRWCGRRPWRSRRRTGG